MAKNEYEWLDKQIAEAKAAAIAAGKPTPIKMYLQRHGLTQHQVSVANGLPQSTMQRAANSSYENISSRTYLLLAQATEDKPAQVYSEMLDINNQLLAARDIETLQDHLSHMLADQGDDLTAWRDFSGWLRNNFPDDYFDDQGCGVYKGNAGTVVKLEMLDDTHTTGDIKAVETDPEYTVAWHKRSVAAVRNPDAN